MGELCARLQDGAVEFLQWTMGIENIRSMPSKKTLLNEQATRQCWEQLTAGRISPRQLVERLKCRVGASRARNHVFASNEAGLQQWDRWVDAQIALEDHDYTLKLSHLRDHDYAKNCHVGRSADLDEQQHARPNKKRAKPQGTPPEMNALITEALSEPPNEVLVRLSGLAVTRSSLETLSGLQWLDDIIISAYSNLIVKRNNEDPSLPYVYAFSPFFLPKLNAKGFDAVRRWTEGEDIFAYDMLLVPVHSNDHWSLAIVDFKDKNISYMDSLGRPNVECLETLTHYLEDEMWDKKRSRFNFHEWLSLPLSPDLLRQENGSDCGVFMLKYADCATHYANFDFNQKDMPEFRRQMMLAAL